MLEFPYRTLFVNAESREIFRVSETGGQLSRPSGDKSSGWPRETYSNRGLSPRVPYFSCNLEQPQGE